MRIKGELPINKTAALVTQRASEENTFNAKEKVNNAKDDYWKAPRKCIKYKESTGLDLTGLKVHRSIVIGYLGGGKFQLRCCCGNYYQRRAKKIKNMKPINGICGECQLKYYALRRNDYMKHGFNKYDIDWYILNR